ncbi:hypothetical protein ACISK3_01490 [Morganella morganii]|nr:hypothetical protein [Morganella morganii]
MSATESAAISSKLTDIPARMDAKFISAVNTKSYIHNVNSSIPVPEGMSEITNIAGVRPQRLAGWQSSSGHFSVLYSNQKFNNENRGLFSALCFPCFIHGFTWQVCRITFSEPDHTFPPCRYSCQNHVLSFTP